MEEFKLVAKSRLFSQIEVRNVFYLEAAVMPTPAELLTDMPAYLTGFYTPLLTMLSTVWALYGWDLHRWNASASTWDFVIAGTVTLAGGNGTDALPTQCAAVLVAYTLTKRVFARKFIAGMTDQSVIANVLVPSAIICLTNSLVFWMSDFTAPSAKVYSPVTQIQSNAFVTFSQAIVDNIAGTMRRRKAGVGI